MSSSDLLNNLRQMLDEKNPEATIALRLEKPQFQPQVFALFIIFHEAYEACTQAREPMVGKIKIAWWRERIEEIMAGTKPRPHPALLALGSKFEYYSEILRILEAFERILDNWQPKTFAEIEEFIRATFSALFTVCVKITGATQAEQLGFAYGNLYLLRKLKLNQNMFLGSAEMAQTVLEKFENNLGIEQIDCAFAIIIGHYKKHLDTMRWWLLLKLLFKSKSAF